MKNQVQIYHHLGLGDHIICNGLVRELCKTHETVYCFVKYHNMGSVSFMYRDEGKIQLIGVEDDWQVPFKLKAHVDLLKIGFGKTQMRGRQFDADFYQQCGLEFGLRWDGFYVERDYRSEYQLLHRLNPNNLACAFVHDDPIRGLFADVSVVGKGLKLIKPSDYFVNGRLGPELENFNLFHWIRVLETCDEIHCMDSSFKCLIESLPSLGNTKLVFHRYIKGAYEVCSTRKNWIVVKTPTLSFMVRNSMRRVLRKLASASSCNGRSACAGPSMRFGKTGTSEPPDEFHTRR